MMDENCEKSMRDILPNIFNYLKEQQYVRNVLHQDLGHKSHASKLKHPEERECLWFFSNQRHF
ncbi:unnamed protein product, partial [Hymenolepis diminuta]